MDEVTGGDDMRRAVVTGIRWVVIVAGIAAVVPVVAALVLRQVTITTPWAAAYVSVTPFIPLAGLGALVLFLLARWWAGVALAAVLTALLALTQAPLFLGTSRPDGRELTVMTVNVLKGNADARDIVANVRRRDVDLLTVQELTPRAVDALARAGIDDVLPSSVVRPDAGSTGNGMWSRHPLEPAPAPDGFTHPPAAATMDVGGFEIFVASVHPVSPYPGLTPDWADDLRRLADWLGEVDGPAIVGGDFNATFDHRVFRDVLATGYRDAAEQVGAGYLPTFPANRRRVPLLITIDHVIVGGGIVATDIRRAQIDRTDHEALVATLVVPGARSRPSAP